MDCAFCFHSDVNDYIVAEEFDLFTPAKRDRLGKYLRCPDCDASAAFRRKSIDGKSACFFAHHAESCVPTSPEVEREAAKVTREVAAVLRDLSVLELNLDEADDCPHSPGSPSPTAKDKEPDRSRVGRRHTGAPTKPALPAQVGGCRLLRYLTHSYRFRHADLNVHVPGMDKPFRPGHLFRRFAEAIVPEGKDWVTWHGYWGRIVSTDRDMKWLNTGGLDSVSVRVDERIREAVYRKWGMSGRDGFKGASCLVFGRPVRSHNSDKVYFKVKRESNIVLCLRGR